MPALESSRVMKANAFRDAGERLAFNFDDLRRQADDYLADVRQKAAQFLVEAEQERQQLAEAAQKAGYEAGHREGLKQADELIRKNSAAEAKKLVDDRLQSALPALQSLVQELKADRDEWMNRWETTAIDLCLAIAGKVIRRTITEVPETTQPMLRDVLQLVAGQATVQVSLHPKDYETFGPIAEQTIAQVAGVPQAKVIVDESLQPGDCRLVTAYGEIDARVETMLSRIADELFDRNC